MRIVFGPEAMLGPGKADLLERIRDTGSIAAAGRTMGMSYKRAWMLVETMNGTFTRPLVEGSRGGAKGGGARLTETGVQVLARYRQVEERARDATAEDLAALESLCKADIADGK